MRAIVRPLLMKASRLSTLWWQILMLLVIGVFLKSLTLVLWDVGSASLLLSEKLFYHIGIDFLGAAVLLSLSGHYLWILSRQKGYGAAGVSAVCVLVSAIALIGYEWFRLPGLTDFLFILKYVLWLILTGVFWTVAGRFVPTRFDSLKFVTIFCVELVGFGLGGVFVLMVGLSPVGNLIASLFCMMGVMLVLKSVNLLSPVPKETFIKKTDGIRDVFERPLVLGILTLAFCHTASRAMMDGVLYGMLNTPAYTPQIVLGLIWSLFGFVGLLTVMALYRTRYIYTTPVGMLVLSCSVVIAGVWGIFDKTALAATFYFVFLIGSSLYFGGFLQILPRPLSSGVGPRLKRKRLILAEPLGFVFAGSVFLNLNEKISAVVLAGLGCVFVLVVLQVVVLYSRILLRLIQMRLWHGGMLMVAYPKLTRYLYELLKGKNEDDVIYALRILEVANHPSYESCLVKSLKHPAPAVRLFAVRKMRKLYRFTSFTYLFETILKKDSSSDVRNLALTNLILICSEQEDAKEITRYLPYLDNKLLRLGAISGFLRIGGDVALLAMDGLQQLARSRSVKDNLAALDLMAEAPSPAFVRLVDRLLKHPSGTVVRKALLTAGAMKNPLLLSGVFKALDDPSLQEEALEALRLYEKAAFPPLEKMLTSTQTTTTLRKTLILFLGALPSGEGKQILIRALSVENQKLRKAIIQNIMDSGIVWIHRDKKEILRQSLEKDIRRIHKLMALRDDFEYAPTHEAEESFSFFTRALQEDIDDTRELILYQLLLLINNRLFVKAVRILLGTSYELYEPALGMIQDLLPGRLYHDLKPILVLPRIQKRQETLNGLTTQEAVQRLSDLILKPPFAVNHWIRATALYALRRLGLEEGEPAAVAALSDPHPVVLEAAIWALVRLEPDQNKLHRLLLKIPTSRLAGQSLDKILEG